METSAFQSFKHWVLSVAVLSKDAVHIYVGLLCFLSFLPAAKKSDSLLALIPGGIVTVLLEVPDLRDDPVTLGYFRWAASVHDVVNTLF